MTARRAGLVPTSVALALVLAACRGSTAQPVDGAPVIDGPVVPDAIAYDTPPALPWVDFSVQGCEAFDPNLPQCRGHVPLTLRFVPISPSPVDTFLWSLGEGNDPLTDRDPLYTYTTPGTYTVTLTAGGPGGTAQETKDMFVLVEPVGLGAPCAQAEQCEPALECVCDDATVCPTPLADGVCTRACDANTPCLAPAVCADLAPDGDANTSWRRALCLDGCADASTCRTGFACRELRAGDGTDTWVRACFPDDVLRDDGASCADLQGQPDSSQCASGQCWAQGARGVCAGVCDTLPCASTSACATITGSGEHVCLARCDSGFACDQDPWLACEAPDAAGALGFTVSETPAPNGYCAPRRCTVDAECGPAGACVLMAGRRFCRAR